MKVDAIILDCESLGVTLEPRPGGRISVNPYDKLSDELREQLVANKPEIHAKLIAYRRLHVHRVLVRLKDILPYRSGKVLLWHGNPSPEQHQLLKRYGPELLKVLTPRLVTDREAD